MKVKVFLALILFLNLENCGVKKRNEVNIIGIAENAKLGAIVISEKNNDVYYLDGVESWPEDIYGKLVDVIGLISIKEYSKNEKSPYLVELEGPKRTILKPKWKIVQDSIK